MRFSFDEVSTVLYDECSYYDGEPLIWFEMVWKFIDKHGLNVYNTIPEKIQVYSRIHGMCLIYSKFCDIISGGYGDVGDIELNIAFSSLHVDYMDEEDEQIVDLYLSSIIHDDDNVIGVFRVLSDELGLSKTFASLYYTLHYSNYSIEDWETDEYYYGDDLCSYYDDYETRKEYAQCDDMNLIFNDILNEVDFDRMEAFSWLSNYM